jgi:hypothetical protein
MGDGIAPTNDPILLFRSPTYGFVAHPDCKVSNAGISTVTEHRGEPLCKVS